MYDVIIVGAGPAGLNLLLFWDGAADVSWSATAVIRETSHPVG